MYKMLSVCLALTISLNATEVKTNNQSKTNPPIELKKAKTFENTLINVQSSIKSNKTKTITREKFNNIGSLEVLNKLEGLNVKHKKKDKVGKDSQKIKSFKEKNPKPVERTNSLEKEEQNIELVKEETKEEQIAREKFLIHGNTGQLRTVRPQYVQGPRRSRLSGLQRIRESNDLFFSEYAEGSASNKYVEIYNGTSSAIDLSGYAYAVVQNDPAAQGEADNWEEFETGATIAAGDVYVICGNQSSDSAILDACDETSNLLSNGDDGWALVKGIETDFDVLDVIGQNIFDPTYSDPGSSWAVAGVSSATKNHTLVRKPTVQEGNINWVESAGTNTDDSEWIVLDIDDFSNLGSHEVEMDDDGHYFSEDFEGDFPPVDWGFDGDTYSDYNGYSYTAAWGQGPSSVSWSGSDGPSFANSGDYCAFFNDYDFSEGISASMITPDIDLIGAVAPKLSFYYWDGTDLSNPDFVDIQVGDIETGFTSVLTTPTNVDDWTLLEVSLADYVGQVINVRFVGISEYGSTNPHIDDILVAEPPVFPIATLSADFLDFGDTFVSSSKQLDVGLSNIGGGDLSATATSTNSNFTVSAIPGRIAPGTTAPVAITYTPTAAIDDSGYVIITHNADSSPDTIVVFGSGSLDPLYEGFDGNWTGTPAAPAGWQVVNSDADAYTWTQSNTWIPEVDGYGAHGMGSQDDWLISPTIALADNYLLKWWDVVESATRNNTYSVWVYPNGDITAGDSLGVYDCINTVLTEHMVDLSAYNGQSISIGFHQIYSAATNYGFGIDDVTVELAPTVPIVELSDTSVDFPGVFVSSSSQKTVTVSNTGGAVATVAVSSSNSKFVASLSSSTIAAQASADLTIIYTPTEAIIDMGYVILTHDAESSPDTVIVTGDGNFNVITEGFDGNWTGTPAAPVGWQVVNSDADAYTWTQSNTYIPEVDGYGAHGMGSQDDWLISPTVALADNYLLKWWDVVESATYNNTYSVWVYPNGVTTAGDSLGVYDCSNTDLTQHSLNLSAYNGQSISIGFHQIYSASTYWGFGIDDVTVELAPIVPILSLSDNDVMFPPTELDSTRGVIIGVSNAGSGDLSGTITYTTGLSGPAAFTNTDNSVDVAFTGTQLGSFSGSVYFTSNGGNDTVDVSTVVGKSVATWDDDFDNDGESDWPVGWQVSQIAQDDGTFAGSGWSFYSDGGHSGQGYTSADAGGYGTVNDDWLISPIYQVVAGDSVSFYASDDGGDSDYPDIMTVHVSPTASTNPSTFTVELDSVANMGGSWIRYAYDLSAYVGTDVRIAIVYRGEYGYALNVDDVVGPKVIAPTGPVIYDYPMAMDFSYGDTYTAIGNTDTVTFDYINNGGADLEVSAVTFEGPFSLSSNVSLPVVTTPGSIGSFDVVFSPIEDGSFSGSMTIANNAGDDISIPLYGLGFGGAYREGFGFVGADGYLSPWSEGWMFSDDGVMCPTDQACSNETGGAWARTSISGQGIMYHNYNNATDADTAISRAIVLPDVTPGYHFELDTEEYMSYGSDANDINGFAVSTDGGATFTLIGEPNYSASGVHSNSYNLSGYDGQTIHIALVYKGTYAQAWGVLTMEIIEKPDLPVFSKLVFPVTALGDSASRKVYYQNRGALNYSADISYPSSMTGPVSIIDLAPGSLDSMVVTYTPSTVGIHVGDIVVDGSAYGSASVTFPYEANSGELAFDLETRSAGWQQYSLGGQPWVAPSGAVYSDTWTWFGGTGHSGPNYYGVYSYGPYWGGVDDYLVSPRYSLSDASEVISFYASGGDNTERDSLNVWVSTERPQMGFEIDTDGMRVDTGFVNTSAFTMAYEALPTNIGWDPVNVVLPTDQSDVWVMIHSVQHYKEDGTQDGWMLKVDDLGTPKIYENPLPVLRVGTRYDFGVTNPDGDSVKYFIRNTGSVDLVIDSMNFDDGMYFDVEYADAYPITISTWWC